MLRTTGRRLFQPHLIVSQLDLTNWFRGQQISPRFANVERYKRMELPIGTLIGFGNPLLDITVEVDDNLLLEKYNLNNNEAILAEEKHMPLFDELTEMEEVLYSAGGSCQNTLRVFQWIVSEPFRSTFIGAIGDDKFGELVGKRAKANGVETQYQIKEEKVTGTCAVIVQGKYRSLIANLGAAAFFDEEELESEEMQCKFERACTFYITGFFLAVSPTTVSYVGKYCNENKRTFVFNLSAAFVMHTHKEAVAEIMPYVDILIGNKQEALAFAESQEWETRDLFEIGQQIQSWPKESLNARMVLLTDQTCPVLLFTDEGHIKEFHVPKVNKKDVVDSNGCGDAFIGSFLAQYLQRMPVDYCIRAGIWAAQQILKVNGVTVEKLPKFEESCI